MRKATEQNRQQPQQKSLENGSQGWVKVQRMMQRMTCKCMMCSAVSNMQEVAPGESNDVKEDQGDHRKALTSHIVTPLNLSLLLCWLARPAFAQAQEEEAAHAARRLCPLEQKPPNDWQNDCGSFWRVTGVPRWLSISQCLKCNEFHSNLLFF